MILILLAKLVKTSEVCTENIKNIVKGKKIGRTKCQTDNRFRRTIFTLGRTMSDVRPLF